MHQQSRDSGLNILNDFSGIMQNFSVESGRDGGPYEDTQVLDGIYLNGTNN